VDTFRDLSGLALTALEQSMTLLEGLANPREGGHLVAWASTFVRLSATVGELAAHDPINIRIYRLHVRMIHLTAKFPA
jgi:hypothetical protein